MKSKGANSFTVVIPTAYTSLAAFHHKLATSSRSGQLNAPWRAGCAQ